MAITGWIVDKSAGARGDQPTIAAQLSTLAGPLCVCPMGELEQLHSARSGREYDEHEAALRDSFEIVTAPADVLERAIALQRDLAHHHGMWHRIPIPDLVIAETALHHGLGIVHIDGDYERIAEVRPLTVRRLG